MNDKPLSGRVLLVTGGAKNLGRRVALDAAAMGAAVVVNTLHDAGAAKAVADEIRASWGAAHAVVADVTEPAAVRAMVVEASDVLGDVTAVVHCAAYRSAHRPITELSTADWKRSIEVCVDGAFLCAKATLPAMVQAKFGRFVFIGGSVTYTGRPEGTAHGAAAKSGLDGLARSIAQEFGVSGITANVVTPGALDTERTRAFLGSAPWDPVAMSTTKRLVRLEEVSSLCLYLCTETAGSVNGAQYRVDGGLNAR